MTNIEEGGHRSVAHADSMYYQSGETKEETTSTSSTTSRARADADAYEARSDTIPAALSPPRPSVSDLFAALEAQRVYEPIEDASPPEQPDAWDQIEEEPRSHISPENREAAAPVMLPSTASGQPLPPEPGEPEEGVIVVRAVAVTDQPAIGTDERNLLTEIESALTMTNSRPPSDMEMSLYWQIARDCDDAARNQPGPGSGLGWVLAAITEAVYSSGSGRVAPKYVARICERWTADGYMSDGRTPPVFAVPAPPPQWPLAAAIPAALTVPARAPETEDSPPTPSPADTMLTDAELARLWPAVVRRLEGILPSDSLKARWFTEARVLSVVGERATVQASDAETALKLTNYRGLISRRLSDVLGRPIEAVFQAAPPLPPEPDTAMPAADSADGAPGIAPEVSSLPPQTSTRVNTMSTNYAPAPMPSPWSWPAAGSGASSQTAPLLPAEITPRAAMGSGPIPVVPPLTRSEATSAASVSPKPVRVVSREQPLEAGSASASLSVLSSSVPTFAVAGSDETNREIWPRVLARLREGLTDVTFKVWMEPTALIAIDADGTFVIGARNRVQRERLERQHAADIAAALSALLDRAVPVRIAVIGE